LRRASEVFMIPTTSLVEARITRTSRARMRPLTLIRLRGVRVLSVGHRPPEEWKGGDGCWVKAGQPRFPAATLIALSPATRAENRPPPPRLTAPAMRHSDGTCRPHGPPVQNHL